MSPAPSPHLPPAPRRPQHPAKVQPWSPALQPHGPEGRGLRGSRAARPPDAPRAAHRSHWGGRSPAGCGGPETGPSGPPAAGQAGPSAGRPEPGPAPLMRWPRAGSVGPPGARVKTPTFLLLRGADGLADDPRPRRPVLPPGADPHLYLRVALQLLLHLGLPEGLGHQGCFFQALPGGGGEVPGFPNQSRAPTRAGLRTSPHPLGLGELPPAPPGAGQNWEPPPAPPRPLSCCPGPGVSTPHGLGGGSPEGQGTPTARS